MPDDTSFKLGLTVCDVQPGPDGWRWQPFVAVDERHPSYGSTFVQTSTGHNLSHVVHVTGTPSYNARWWFMVGDGCPDEDSALRQLQRVSDELTHFDRKN